MFCISSDHQHLSNISVIFIHPPHAPPFKSSWCNSKCHTLASVDQVWKQIYYRSINRKNSIGNIYTTFPLTSKNSQKVHIISWKRFVSPDKDDLMTFAVWGFARIFLTLKKIKVELFFHATSRYRNHHTQIVHSGNAAGTTLTLKLDVAQVLGQIVQSHPQPLVKLLSKFPDDLSQAEQSDNNDFKKLNTGATHY